MPDFKKIRPEQTLRIGKSDLTAALIPPYRALGPRLPTEAKL